MNAIPYKRSWSQNEIHALMESDLDLPSPFAERGEVHGPNSVPKGWLPARIVWEDSKLFVDWRPLGDAGFREPFFEDSLRAALAHPEVGAQRLRTSIDSLEEIAAALPETEIGGLILHWSRCGSTLISQMLASVPEFLVLSEAPPVDVLLESVVRQPELGEDWVVRQLRAFVRVMAGALPDRKRVFLKLDCWHSLQLPLLEAAFPKVPWVFVYRDPVEVLVSHERRCGSQMLPGSVHPSLLATTMNQVLQVPLEEYAARLLAAIGGAALDGLGSGLGRLLNYRQLPLAVTGPLMSYFAIPMDPRILQGMFEVAEFHAKEPGKKFKPDSAGKRADADADLFAVAEQFVGLIFRELECARKEGFGLESNPQSETCPLPKCFRLPVLFDVGKLQRELRGMLGCDFIAHFNSAYYEGDWSALPLRSLGGRLDQIYPDPTQSESYADTVHLAQCPYFQSVLAYFQCPLHSVRLLRLGAGSVIREHRDLNLGFEDGEVRLHIPVVTNSEVEFYLDRERVIMAEGECWYNNLSLPHSVVNRGIEDRIHLVLDMQLNEWLRDVLFAAAGSQVDTNPNLPVLR